MSSVTNLTRVRRASSDRINRQIDQLTDANIARYRRMSPEVIQRRITALDREWDVERVLELNASTLALTGLVLGLTKSAKWFVLPGVVLPFLLQHAIQGWCPPLPVLRRLGIRTRGEIDREKYALLETLKTSSH
ncbi:MAG: hypothetical protein JKY26_13435 [Pseudomonas sp.]|jgi:hypothetical protein|nr:hypothetical protein [Pseudomonas sp.]